MFQYATSGDSSVELTNCRTVGDCLKKLSARYPQLRKMLFDEEDKLSGFLNVFINGQRAGTGNEVFTHPIREEDEIYPIVMIDGG
jgi:hypothetical protein